MHQLIAVVCSAAAAIVAAVVRAKTSRRDSGVRHAAKSHREWIDYGAGGNW